MKTRMQILLAFAAVGMTATAQSPHFEPSVARAVALSESQAPPVIRTGLLQSTLIELPVQEKVATVFGGDTATWIFDAGHVASRFISVKPKVADASTDLHIISDHGNDYTLQLCEVSSDKDNPHFDSKISISSNDPKAAENISKPPVFLPAAEVELKETQLKREAEDAKKAADAERHAASTAEELFRATYPRTLRFDYAWDQKKGNALGVRQIWRDDKFTYLHGEFQETPALYELKDGKGSLINYDFANGLYTVPKTLIDGYLSIGKQRVDFRQIKAAR